MDTAGVAAPTAFVFSFLTLQVGQFSLSVHLRQVLKFAAEANSCGNFH